MWVRRWVFFIETSSGATTGRKRSINSIVGRLSVSEKQAQILNVQAHNRWSPLVENLGKVGGSQQRLDKVEACLWRGDIDGAIEQFNDWRDEQVDKFIAYLNQHRRRIVNYAYYQAEGISIGSGAIESTIKQIGRRIKISGTQWERDNVPQVLKYRCAYLNGQWV